MQILWFITNPGSGSTSAASCAALEAVFAEHGLRLAGRTRFPDEGLPSKAMLARRKVDTVVLFGGDGTVNAALEALAGWRGAFLILPGGTMNVLARALHGSSDAAAIIHAAHNAPRRVALPFVEVGARRAFVGLILGPATAWVRAREAARRGRLARLLAAAHLAWNRTFGGSGIRIEGAPGLVDRYQAVLVRPDPKGLRVIAVDARDWRSIVELGWGWLTGDWVAARAATESHAATLRVCGKRRVVALFDGEPVTLEPGVTIAGAISPKMFLATREDAA